MSPIIDLIWLESLKPYLDGDMQFLPALESAQGPIRGFMFDHTRDSDLALFAELGGYPVFLVERRYLFCIVAFIPY